ncbi:homeobox protein Hox-C8-like [Agrilus planipennis]|uniref:Homeobox protein Hox-C8-like n=1 Tax=Agrilus planipennis TaxID=224129 RepID=A0A1W4WXS8_AGRPL|nr:homeobox protein Hox-C8-like [Agrilus planipennis]
MSKGRVPYTDDQLQRLEKEFAINPYPVLERRRQLVPELKLTEKQIKIWFQNRRVKQRRSNWFPDLQGMHSMTHFLLDASPYMAKKGRKRFTPDQMKELEKEFARNPYPCPLRRSEISQKLESTPSQVTMWFQNRRKKQKKDRRGTKIDPKSQNDEDEAEETKEKELSS